jgi:competence protein ComEC
LIPSASTGTNLNNASVVTQLDCGPHSFLFAADLEVEGLLRIKDLAAGNPIQVVKVPHHGARSSLAPVWIHTIKPQVAVISVGRRNPYGHPSPQVLAAYEQEKARLYRTDRDGAVVVTGSLTEHGLVVRTARAEFPQSVQIGSGLWRQEGQNAGLVWRQWLGP